MTMLKILTLGADLGSVWLCCEDSAPTFDVGCMINCGNIAMQFAPAVSHYWLHIAYPGELDHISWEDRVVGAMRKAILTLLHGEDVAVYSRHGPQIGERECM